MNLKLASAVAVAALATAAFAQEEDEVETTESSTEATAVEAAPQQPEAKPFYTLPLCLRVQGKAEVRLRNTAEWQTAEEGRYYPLGSTYRAAPGGSLIVAFGAASTVTVADGSSFATADQPLGTKSRTIKLVDGEVGVLLPGGLKPGLFFVEAPSFEVVNPAGESRYSIKSTGDGTLASVRCVTGTMEVKGRHFAIPLMHAADAFDIRATQDNLETILYGRSGDFVLRLDQGLIAKSEFQDDGSVKSVIAPASLDWHLSVATRVQINRAVSAIGERLGVTMMTFDSAGQMKNHFAYTEGRAEVNTGELIHDESNHNDEVNKRAAEATTESAATDVEDDEPAESSESASDSASTDEETSSASSDEDDDF